MPVVNHELLRRKRDERDISNGELAALVGSTSNYVSNILRGADKPGMRMINRLARALELNPDDIVAAKPTGDPTDPPLQPTGPTGPTRRQDVEKERTGPRRVADDRALAGAP
ncbi:helix-turn-helix domain-containing protein [Amycolatopsis roodepoortensis]|uniref:helix-turn-helix domain-containing protein n=1 Tax=Amycolatopsis roodepoortensis TaxID=700274 RepID=UPI00214C91D9|nr:helix-turn-helix transcriptional regulator [Amycolatopsis roodepoortensis]UUV29111.1 helix-turn-helix domain-containing protein [Amycolatopsis roodepoortensis]